MDIYLQRGWPPLIDFTIISGAGKVSMSDKTEIKEIKSESRGILQKQRSTSQASDGTIGVSDWHDSKSDAVKQSRERVGEIQKQSKKK